MNPQAMKSYPAPWAKSLKITSALMVGLAVIVPIFLPALLTGPRWQSAMASWLLPLIVAGCFPFQIRGYRITPEAILIRRLGWTTRLSRTGLDSAEVMPDAMKGSIRLCGNGGLFSFTGWFRNGRLGTYRAYVSDPSRAVVLRFGTRAIVVSPGSPEEFVRDLDPP